MAFENSPDVDATAARGRKVTEARGGHIEPENATPRASGSSRDAYGRPGPQVDQGKSAGPSGDPQSHTLPNEQVPMVMSGPSGDAKTLVNPVK